MMYKIFIAIVVALLSACVSKPINWDTNDYTVKSGDTLYSIAWRFEIDPDDLVRWNKLSNSSLIYPGQRLHTAKLPVDMTGSGKVWTPSAPIMGRSRTRTTTTTTIKTVVVKQDQTLYAIAKKQHLSVKQLAAYNNIKKPYLIRPGQRLNLSATNKVASVKRKSGSKSPRITGNTKIIWQWPIKGELIKTFNKRLNNAKGIDIAGKSGNRIEAAAAGKVVYSGNGLISYGNLIIIKHNSVYLSAYAHNRKLLVKEGQTVKKGQVIAELGKTGADNPRLHFEIRKNGKPVNPVHYLPSS